MSSIAVSIGHATQMIGLQLTIRGSEWFPRAAAGNLLHMAGSGALDFSCFKPRVFPLDKAQEAAALTARGFGHVVIAP